MEWITLGTFISYSLVATYLHPANHQRQNVNYFDSSNIEIVDGTYENRPHFVIRCPNVTYYYDKSGGGFSRILDNDGIDWINYKKEPWDAFPASAASSYRGIPNLVFGSSDNGVGHPGHNKCTSIKLNSFTIFTKSSSEQWEWKWEFFPGYAKLTMINIDPGHSYWFLYEGIPGGMFEPKNQYFGHNLGGPFSHTPDYIKGEKIFEKWQWFYTGAKKSEHVFFITQLQPDRLSDTFSYLGNSEEGIDASDGMIVFGFGRAESAKPLLTSKQSFIIGFFDRPIFNRKQHKRIAKFIGQLPEIDLNE